MNLAKNGGWGVNYYAHSKEGLPPKHWQPLDEHLKAVADMAADFAKPFGGEEWAYLAGLWHEIIARDFCKSILLKCSYGLCSLRCFVGCKYIG